MGAGRLVLGWGSTRWMACGAADWAGSDKGPVQRKWRRQYCTVHTVTVSRLAAAHLAGLEMEGRGLRDDRAGTGLAYSMTRSSTRGVLFLLALPPGGNSSLACANEHLRLLSSGLFSLSPSSTIATVLVSPLPKEQRCFNNGTA